MTDITLERARTALEAALRNGGLITFPGGVPLKDGSGAVVGAIRGVRGPRVDQDHDVASAGADAL
ncbi:hypothetical protein BH24ACI4_BH24ACI4_03630 [soil metagenome]